MTEDEMAYSMKIEQYLGYLYHPDPFCPRSTQQVWQQDWRRP